MIYTVYKITNNLNGMIYIGVHKTNNINDGYMGSGTYLKRAIRKYGLENFSKEILAVFDNPIEMFQMEKMLVNEEFVSNTNTYNTKLGGSGGWDHISKEQNRRNILRLNERMKTDSLYKDVYRKAGRAGGAKIKERLKTDIYYQDMCRKAGLALVAKNHEKYPNGTFFEKSHTEETKAKIGKANAISQSGSGNSQYGTRWIYSLTEKTSKKIQKDQPLPDGWLEGRKIKF